MHTYIVVTNNSEKYIEDVLKSILLLRDDEELIIWDNKSKDNTVPIIVSTMGTLWTDDRHKFFIGMKKERKKDIVEKLKGIAKYDPIVINKRSRFDLDKELKKC